MEILRDLLPLTVLHISSTATVLTGFALILLADGLRKRRERAMHLTVALLLGSTVLNLIKGLDFEEASVSLILGGLLLAGRAGFDVRSRITVPLRVWQQILALSVLYVCYVLAGFLVLRHAIAPSPTLLTAVQEPIRLIGDTSQFHYLTPHAQWFARSLVAMGSLGVLFILGQLLRPLLPARPSSADDIGRARSLVDRFGTDTLSYFTLQDGRSYFFDSVGEAVLSYRLWGTVAVVGGDPVGPRERWEPLLASFLDFASAHGMDPCFVGVSTAAAPIFARLGLRLLKIGEEAVVILPSFDEGALKRKVRRAGRHIESLGIAARCYRVGNVPQTVRDQIEEVSRQWVGAKGGAEQGFSMTLGRLPRETDSDCELVVAMEGGHVWGYLSLVPVAGGLSWSLDAMRRRPESPNGLTEFLVLRAATMYRDRGCQTLSLNFATLADTQGELESRALAGTRKFLWENLSSVYQLKSLYQFNSKFNPTWHSRYLAYNEVLKIPKLAVAVAQCEAPIQAATVTPWTRRAP
jgi:lysyl-tRNA synthetase class 2